MDKDSRMSIHQATVSYDAPRSTISDKILNNTLCSVQNLEHFMIIAFCIMICLECNYSVALFIK